jgi:hypothetical protein
MAQTYRSRFLSVVRQNEEQMTALLGSLAAYAAQEVNRRADADGNVSKGATYGIQAAVGSRVIRAFLGRTEGGEREALRVLKSGAIYPMSDYPRILWSNIEKATQIYVEKHAGLMNRYLERAPQVKTAMQHANLDPFQEAKQVSEQILRVFKPNPLAQYEPPHRWVDPNGYTLSERIWRTAGNTRRKLDLFLEERIAQGDGALRISRDLESFLQPGRQLRRTTAPYGTDASYDAMRLARTEIARAAARANEMSAAMNPFVKGIETVLSPQHPCCDICDEAAESGPWPVDEIPDKYQIPMHPHCMCHYREVLIDNPQEVLDELRNEIRSQRRQLTVMIGPLRVVQFTRLLLQGASVMGIG